MASSPGAYTRGPGDRPDRVTVEAGETDAITVAVVEVIAAVEGVDPVEVDVRLDEHVDPDALDALYRHARANDRAAWSLEFDLDGHAVTVESDGRVAVD